MTAQGIGPWAFRIPPKRQLNCIRVINISVLLFINLLLTIKFLEIVVIIKRSLRQKLNHIQSQMQHYFNALIIAVNLDWSRNWKNKKLSVI